MDATLLQAAQGAPSTHAPNVVGCRTDMKWNTKPHARVARSWLATALLLVAACSQQPESMTAAERGRRAYMTNCIVCHNRDPSKPGGAGPELAGASRELLEARVVRGTYPGGYAPKRSTNAMVALPYLAPKIDDLAAFLAATDRGAH